MKMSHLFVMRTRIVPSWGIPGSILETHPLLIAFLAICRVVIGTEGGTCHPPLRRRAVPVVPGSNRFGVHACRPFFGNLFRENLPTKQAKAVQHLRAVAHSAAHPRVKHALVCVPTQPTILAE